MNTDHKPKVGDKWYRYQEIKYAPMLDEWDCPVRSGTIELNCHEYTVVKVTPKGVWLDDSFYFLGISDDAKVSTAGLRFVLTAARKRFACPTKGEALESYIARKTRQGHILQSQISRTKAGLKLAENELRKLTQEHDG